MGNEHIEEMAKDIAEAIKHNSAVDVIRHGLICVNSEGITRELYDEGYRKQIEGEWLGSWDYKCSACNEYHDIKTKHCPNCGAKMKGGAE